MEVEPLTDKFEQIMLTDKAYKRILDALQREMRPKEKGFIVNTNDDNTCYFKDIKDFYSQEEIDKD